MPIYRRKEEQDAHPLEGLAAALDRVSWQWLQDNHPLLAEALELAVAGGAMPAEVRRFVMMHTGRYELALRCEQAARWLGAE
jgi:hypothetical protein